MKGAMQKGDAPRVANRRGAARLAAVQALYQMDLGAVPLEDVIAEFETYRFGQEVDGDTYRDADRAFFRDIVSGVVRDQRRLDMAIATALAANWPLDRLDATLRAVLRAGAFELAARPDVPAAVVITEYVDVAKAFFDAEAASMANGVLDTLARRLRPQDGAISGAGD